MKNLTRFLLVGIILCVLVAPIQAATGVDADLTKQIADVLKECQGVKPGTTRAQLSRVFTTEGGLFTARHRTYVYRGCPYIKVDVDFTLSGTKQGSLAERPGDIIAKISKPYLDWGVID